MQDIMENELPLYYRIVKDILTKMKIGELKKDSRLKTEMELAEEYKVSRTTVRHAMGFLERDGYVKRIVGKGTYVIDDYENLMGDQWVVSSIDDLLETTKRTEIEYGPSSLIEEPKAWLISDLDLESWNKVWLCRGIKYLNKKPVGVIEVYLPYEIGDHPALSERKTEQRLTFIQNELGIEITNVHQHLSIRTWKGDSIQSVEIEKGEPVVVIKRVYKHGTKPVEVSMSYYSTHKFSLSQNLIKRVVKK